MLQTLATNYAQKGDSLQNSGWDSFWTPVATFDASLKLSSSPRFLCCLPLNIFNRSLYHDFLCIFAFLLFECHHTATLKTTHRQAKMSHTSQTTETHLPQHGCISNTTRTQHWDNHNTILTQDRKERKKHEKLSLQFSASLISTIASFLHVFKTSLPSKRNSEETTYF